MACLLIIVIIIIKLISNIHSYSHFDKTKWNDYPEKRFRMIESLGEQYSLVGMNKQQIFDLLGQNGIIMNTSDKLEYFISPGIGDAVGFIIFFRNDIVVDCKVSLH